MAEEHQKKTRRRARVREKGEQGARKMNDVTKMAREGEERSYSGLKEGDRGV